MTDLHVQTVDAAGNRSAQAAVVPRVEQDATDPAVTIAEPVAGTRVEPGQRVTVRWTSTDRNLLDGSSVVQASTDGGRTFTALGTAQRAAGSLVWTAPSDRHLGGARPGDDPGPGRPDRHGDRGAARRRRRSAHGQPLREHDAVTDPVAGRLRVACARHRPAGRLHLPGGGRGQRGCDVDRDHRPDPRPRHDRGAEPGRDAAPVGAGRPGGGRARRSPWTVPAPGPASRPS